MSLYVGNLHPDCTELILFEIFSNIGPLTLIRLCKDTTTGNSLGYAYVNFAEADDAERAMIAYNLQPLFGKPMRIMWAEPKILNRLSQAANLFVKNLEKSVSDKELLNVFSKYGNVLSVMISRDENGVSNGYGYVQFEKESSADAAIQYLNNQYLGNLRILVSKFLPKDQRTNTIDYSNNVYFKNLTSKCDEKDLRELCWAFGKIKHVEIIRDDQGLSRRIGIVNFENPECAANAVSKLDGIFLNGRRLLACHAQCKTEQNELNSVSETEITKFENTI